MTRKDYTLIANAIAHKRQTLTVGGQFPEEWSQDTHDFIVTAIADAMAEENPAFDWQKFAGVAGHSCFINLADTENDQQPEAEDQAATRPAASIRSALFGGAR